MKTEYYELTKVNEFGEEIDCINKQFDSEPEAWKYLRDVERIKSRKGWEVRFCRLVRA